MKFSAAVCQVKQILRGEAREHINNEVSCKYNTDVLKNDVNYGLLYKEIVTGLSTHKYPGDKIFISDYTD